MQMEGYGDVSRTMVSVSCCGGGGGGSLSRLLGSWQPSVTFTYRSHVFYADFSLFCFVPLLLLFFPGDVACGARAFHSARRLSRR
uniref:Uncharacterized protein n=1 Tax=Leishmania guyanensis TaxID=5670 RepID=A0A1E1IWU1_LEIGU|nr:Hypothetical protein BN36_2332700 [Leishmania guyanensis]